MHLVETVTLHTLCIVVLSYKLLFEINCISLYYNTNSNEIAMQLKIVLPFELVQAIIIPAGNLIVNK